VHARLRVAAEQAGRDPERFRIVAVTKTVPVEVVQAACDAGVRRFGESRLQEARPKIAAVPDAEWDFIGHLQGNKVRGVVAAFGVVHSVDSVALLQRIDAAAGELGRRPAVLLQVNLNGEASRSGFERPAMESPALRQTVAALHHARLIGLMTIGPHHDDPRPTFAGLRELRDRLEPMLEVRLPELSMGMSADAEMAVAEGATLVRIGTALFGPRPT
jgi:PLP dependent protein